MKSHSEMIRVELGPPTGAGMWEFSIPSHRTGAKSRQPLLDACRLIKRMGGDTGRLVGLFDVGSDQPRLVAKSVEVGARLTVVEPSRGHGPSFRPFQPFKGIDHAEL